MDKLNQSLRAPRAALESAIAVGKTLRCVKSMDDYAKLINIPRSTLTRRRKEPAELTIREAKRIAKVAGLDLGDFVAKLSG